VTVTFFLPDDEMPRDASKLDVDRDWTRFKNAQQSWILQTYLRLRAVGADVALSSQLPEDGLAVFYAAHKRQIQRLWTKQCRCLLVGVRGDRHEVDLADVEILQNPVLADSPRRIAMPHWPQPGLIAREAGRGVRLENVAFKGVRKSLHPEFAGPEWDRALQAMGLSWHDASSVSEGGEAPQDWRDFRFVDAVLAVRPPRRDAYPGKPATKLINAWQAGVPAILGPESAYLALRESELDFLIAADAKHALAALRSLKEKPELYRAMVENGFRRARAFDVPALTQRWQCLLFAELLPQAETLRRRTSPRWRRAAGVWSRLVNGRPGR
jgi:hypothetical protein